MYNKQTVPFLTQALIACGGALCLIAGQLDAANLLTNGSFESGDTGFSTDYTNYFNGTTSLNTYTASGSYTVGTDPADNSVPSNVWANIGDHTTGTGSMLELDADTAGNRFWYESVTVVPNTTYTFSYWGTGVDTQGNSSPALVQFTVNGAAVGSEATFSTTSTGNTATTWVNFTDTWNSGANTTALVALSDLNTAQYYNDFAVDDLSFAAPVPEPSIWVATAMAAALLCLTLRRRSRRA